MRRLLPLLVLGLAVAGCAGPEHLAVVGNAPGSLGTGEQRLTVAYRAETGEDLATPDLAATLEVARAEGEPQVVDTEFVWMTEGVRGLYVAYVELDAPGEWTATLQPEGRNPTRPTPFFVDEAPTTPEVGDVVPTTDSETLDDVAGDLTLLTTDPEPDPALYEVSVGTAVSNGTPAVVAFATPRFCVTATCGPMLDQVKALRDRVGDAGIDWVHVEVYELEDVDPSNLQPVPSAIDWGLPSEPWVFVVDAEGRVTHRFEGVVSDAELATAVAEVTGT
jgi:hypothetical protein